MIRIDANEALQALLGGLTEPAEICHPGSGAVLGYFTRAPSEREALYARAAAGFDREEIARRKAAGATGRTTREVLERICVAGAAVMPRCTVVWASERPFVVATCRK